MPAEARSREAATRGVSLGFVPARNSAPTRSTPLRSFRAGCDPPAVHQTSRLRRDVVAGIVLTTLLVAPRVHPIQAMRPAPAEPILKRYGHLRTLTARPVSCARLRTTSAASGAIPSQSGHRRYSGG